MVQLPNNCSCSEFNVFPSNWQSPRASIQKNWYITYRFYDPLYKAHLKYKTGKLVMLKGMNKFKTLPERREATKTIMAQELTRLKEQAYNCITGYSNSLSTITYEIEPTTPFTQAIKKAEARIKCAQSTKTDLRYVLRLVDRGAMQLGFNLLPVTTISRRHIKLLLTHIEEMEQTASTHRYNKVRTYLMIIFNELVELEACDHNPVKDIIKRKGVQRLRKFLSEEKRTKVNEHLREKHRRFWLFTHIFFHSGARLTEMMKVRLGDVDLHRQLFVVTVKKGQLLKEVEKPIKSIAVPFWKEAIVEAKGGDYIFSKNLQPGPKSIQSFQITKRWNKYVKKELGITEDFYSLKHLNLDETAALLDIKDAAAQASHTNTAITIKHYALNEAKRQQERLRQVKNSFA